MIEVIGALFEGLLALSMSKKVLALRWSHLPEGGRALPDSRRPVIESHRRPFRKTFWLSGEQKSPGVEVVAPFPKGKKPHRKGAEAYPEPFRRPSGEPFRLNAKTFWLSGKVRRAQRKDFLPHRPNA